MSEMIQTSFFVTFPVYKGVQQDLELARALFSMMLSAILTGAFQNCNDGTPVGYRFDSKVFNPRKLQAKSKVQTEFLDEFIFTDGMGRIHQTL